MFLVLSSNQFQLCISLRGNSVRVLYISSDSFGIFWSSFDSLIIVFVETFWDPYACKYKHLRKHKLQLRDNAYYEYPADMIKS